MAAQNNTGLLCSFGVLTDTQYADVDNGENYEQTTTRYYRTALHLLRKAAGELNKPKHNIKFLLNLGDLLDGCCTTKSSCADRALKDTLDALKTLNKPVYHVWGNHELYNFSRSKLLRGDLNSSRLPTVDSPGPNKANYYHFVPAEGLRVVILDQFEVSTLGHDPDSKEFQTAQSILRSINKNEDANSPVGLDGMDMRFVEFNGGVSEEQLQWLDAVLQVADERHEKVVVAGHLPIFEPSSCALCLCWNYFDISSILHKHCCVVAYFCGHDHDGGHGVDQRGIHHVTIQGIIETHPEDDAFGIVHLYDDRLVLQGFGRVPTLKMPISSTHIRQKAPF